MDENIINNNNNDLKCCTDCKTTKTPLWRGGPAGPKSLCNACGIRHRKKRRDNEGMVTKKRPSSDNEGLVTKKRSSEKKKDRSSSTSTDKTDKSGGGEGMVTKKRSLERKKDRTISTNTDKTDKSTATSCGVGGGGLMSESFAMRLMSLGKEVLLQRPLSTSTSKVVVVKKQRCQRRRKFLKEEEQAAFSLMALSSGVVFA